ncbi:DUF998 domain-containing protein [Halomarina pelagica]|uniref:DUF998 domain-containing protein n=1 Tax=Halomarina pelagica TaxID=2961599 RepID=UPI0020C50B65|nr:DUF998 domain-containing protein [Halomarina sp. BND7]
MDADQNADRRADPERLGTAAGVLAPVVALGAIALAALRSPTFTWAGSALSDLGAPGTRTAWLFNGGLALGGALALPFAWRLWRAARNRAERAGAVLLALDAVALALVGVFPIGTALHAPAAVSFFLLLSLALWTYSAGNLLAGERRRGAATVALGVVTLGAWVVWAAALRDLAPGLALPEAVGAVALGAWTATTAVRLWRTA